MSDLKKIKLIVIFTVIAITSFAQKKITYGIGLDIFRTTLNNVDRVHYSGYGHSVPGFTQKDFLGFGLNGIVGIPIYKRFGIETGLGLTSYHSQFHFQYFHSFLQQWIDKRLNIRLNYLRLPVNLYYNLRLSQKSSIMLSSGLNLKLLLWVNDNFEEIVLEEIGLPDAYQRYEILIFASSTSISFQYQLEHQQRVELGLNLGRDFNALVNNHPTHPENFGFYANLHRATLLQYGISLKYLFHY